MTSSTKNNLNECTKVDPGTNPGIQGYANLKSALNLNLFKKNKKTYTKKSTYVV